VFHNRSIRAVDPKASMKFDRIYVGAAANAEERMLVAQLLKIGGLCVGPYDNASGGQQMLKLERYGTEGEVRLRETVLMGVNFSSLLRGRELTDVAHDTPANPLETLTLGSKSVPQPSTVAGSRPRVGQSVRVVDGAYRKGQTGTLIEDDGSPNMPFKVRFSDSGILWLHVLDVEAVGPAGGGAVIALEGGSLAGGSASPPLPTMAPPDDVALLWKERELQAIRASIARTQAELDSKARELQGLKEAAADKAKAEKAA
jgi:hypothetical protein